MSHPDYSEDFQQPARAELEWIRKRRRAAGVREREGTTGLALSGGGIRSATFCLGVLQALSKRGILKDVDYLSSVSGGGFVASCLTWIRSQASTSETEAPFDLPVDADGATVVESLRAHDKYLIAEQGFTGWTLGASILASTLLNLLVMLPPLLLLIGFATMDVVPVEWPKWASVHFAAPVQAHDGFVLALWLALGALALYPFAVLCFAVASGVRGASRSTVMRLRRWMGLLINAGVALLCVALVPLIVGIEETLITHYGAEAFHLLVKACVVAVHLSGGFYLLSRTEKKLERSGQQSRGTATFGLALVLYALVLAGYHIVVETNALESGWLVLSACLSVILAFTCDLNRISMHAYYRARLTDAFLPELYRHEGTPQDSYQFPLTDVAPESGAPFPIINTALNVNNSKQQTLRARGVTSFFLSPLFCGSDATGYRTCATYRRGRTTLSTAMTISGAAVDPNIDVTRERPVAFLMALLNFRLGFWAANPRFEHRRLRLPWWYLFIGREMLGHGLSEDRQHIHLTDGGHFDNLGLYELVRRQCRRIIVCDAGADPNLTLSSLGLVTQRARADFGADIVVHADQLAEQLRRNVITTPFVLGEVRYSDGSRGEILFIKPMVRQQLTADIYAYAKEHPDFPNESTSNQFFDEQQFSAYQELGRQIVLGITEDDSIDSIETLIKAARQQTNAEQEEHPTGVPPMSIVPSAQAQES